MRLTRRLPALVGLVTVATASTCQKPQTTLAGISADDLKAEQMKQEQYVVRGQLRDQQRVDDVALPLLRAARELCTGQTAAVFGARFANAYSFDGDYVAAARRIGFTDTLTIVEVTHGSAADSVGLRPGDRVLSVGGDRTPVGPRAVFIGTTKSRRDKPTAGDGGDASDGRGMYQLLVRRGPAPAADSASAASTTSGEVSIAVPGDSACGFGANVVHSDDLNAFADGHTVYVTSAMLRFAASDDELAVVLSHEISHNAMRHMDAKRKNARTGAILGAVLDVAAAAGGVNTGGAFSGNGADIGAMRFSQDFEREADYVGMYVLARSGRSTAGASEFWRRMAQESPRSVRFASSHPTTAERFLRLEQAAAEIERKRAAGLALLPESRPPAK